MTDDLKWQATLNIWIKRHKDAVAFIRELQVRYDRLEQQHQAALSMLTEEQLAELKAQFEKEGVT